MSTREPENVNEIWTNIFLHGFGPLAIFGSLLTFVLLVIWLNLDGVGGLGPRPSTKTTAEYFNWHPLLMSLAFLVFMTPAVLSFEILPFARHINKSIHGFANLLALLTAFAGFAIILDCHNNLSTTGSFHTVHGCIGLTVLIIFACNYFLGFILYGLQLGDSLRGTLKPLHKRLGLCVITLGFTNMSIGILEQEIKKTLSDSETKFTNALGVICASTLICILFTLVKFVDKKDTDIKYTPIQDSTNKTPNYGVGNEQL